MTELVVRTESLGGSPLARAAIDGRLPEWYVARPRTPAEWQQRADAIRHGFADASWMEGLRAAIDPTGAAARRLERVVRGRGIVVTTGQQPGLFGGPLYTWSKALSALALADEIERATGIPAAPLFWAANDDADFAEASWTAVAVPGGAERLEVGPGAPIGRPMSEMPLGDASAAIDALVRACGATLDERPLAVVREAYRRGATVGGAYLHLLRALFEPLGIAVLDASHDAVGTTARPLLARALEQAERVVSAVRERDAAIRAAGFTTQVEEVAGLTLVFERPSAGGEKRRVPVSEAGAALSDPSPRVLSPNVLLRPVIERAILPTVSYVAGPGEIAYFAQATAVAAALALAPPLAVPRWSTTIIEPHVARILGRLGLAAEELADPHEAEGRLARGAIPAPLTSVVAELRRDLDRGAGVLSDLATEAELPIPRTSFEGARRFMHHRVDRLERRIVAAAKRKESDTMRRIATARGALYPLGIRQERALNAIPFLARHGAPVVQRMIAGATEHARALVGTDHEGDESPAAVDEPRSGAMPVESPRAADA